MTDYESLRPYATERQTEMLDALAQHGAQSKAAKALGIHIRKMAEGLARLRTRAAKQGYAPSHDMTHPSAPGFSVKGVSTLYGPDGDVKAQWVKTRQEDEDRAEAMRLAAEAMAESMPRLPPLSRPPATSAMLCNLYTLTDCHVGMLAWRKEGGSDWDLKIAEKTLFGCFEQMVMNSPSAQTAVINQLGDWLHSDGLLAITPTSGHILDQDGRFSKLVSVAIRILRRVIDLTLMKHDKVYLIIAEGNHDMASSVWLRHMFKALYEHEPRLVVDESELPYYAYQHGKTMLAFHHGHLKKNDQLPLLFAAQYPAMWGGTEKRYCHTGHRHHSEEKEHSGMTVIQHPTLAARDAYAARGGWIADRQASAITYHRVFGQVGRVTVCPEMLDEAA